MLVTISSASRGFSATAELLTIVFNRHSSSTHCFAFFCASVDVQNISLSEIVAIFLRLFRTPIFSMILCFLVKIILHLSPCCRYLGFREESRQLGRRGRERRVNRFQRSLETDCGRTETTKTYETSRWKACYVGGLSSWWTVLDLMTMYRPRSSWLQLQLHCLDRPPACNSRRWSTAFDLSNSDKRCS